jgi:hypothetical protein
VWETADTYRGRLLRVQDFLYATIRTDPALPQFVVVSDGPTPVARMSIVRARWLRALLLQQWQRFPLVSTTHRAWWNECDVSAYLLAWVRSNPISSVWPSLPQTAFPGHRHSFPPFALPHYECGWWAPASLPATDEPLLYDPATSAYEPVPPLYRGDISYQAYEHLLPHHPWTATVCTRLRYGFVQQSVTPPTTRGAPASPATGPSATAAKAIIDAEVDFGACFDATDLQTLMALRCVPQSLRPKDSGGYRAILDLSWGVDSVNDGVQRNTSFRARFASLHRILARVQFLKQQHPGRRVQIFRVDASKAFRRIPLAVREYHRCAHRFGNKVYCDTRPAMGGVASGDYCGELLGMLADKLAEAGIWAEVWVDDLICVALEEDAAATQAAVLALWQQVGWPYGADKVTTPSCRATVLGVLVDTEQGTVEVTAERRAKLCLRLQTWLLPGATASPRQYSELAGALEWCTALLPHSKVYMRELYTRTRPNSYGSHDTPLPVPASVQTDLRWFLAILQDLTATARFIVPPDSPSLTIYTDASGTGYGGVCVQRKEVISGLWLPQETARSVVGHWEAAAICLAVGVWGQYVCGGSIVLYTDSNACVGGFTRARCPDTRFYALLRLLSLLQAHHRCHVELRWIAGVRNTAADALSRGTALPPPFNSWNPHPVPASLRALGGLLHTPLPLAASPDHGPTPPPWTTLPLTVSSLGTPSQRPLIWIPWKFRHLTAASRPAACGTSHAGSGPNTLRSPALLSTGTSAPFAKAVPCMSTGSSNGPLSLTLTSSGTSNSPDTATSDNRAPLPSSDACSMTQPSTSPHALQFFWRSPLFCGLESTRRRHLPQTLVTRLCAWATSSSTTTAASPSASPTPSPTGTTRVRRFMYCRLVPRGIALYRPCAPTSNSTPLATTRKHPSSSSRHPVATGRVSTLPMSIARYNRMQRRLDWIPASWHRTHSASAVRSNSPTLVSTGKPSASGAGGVHGQ